MASTSAHGIELRIRPSGTGTYTKIGQIVEIQPPSMSRGVIDVTDHESVDEEFIPGAVRSHGEFTFTVLADPSGQSVQGVVLAGLNSGRRDQFVITEPTGTHTHFKAYGTSRRIETAREDAVKWSFELHPDGGVFSIPQIVGDVGTGYAYETTISLASALAADLLEAGDIRRIGGTTPKRLAIEPVSTDTVAGLRAALHWPAARIRIQKDASNYLTGQIVGAASDVHGMLRVDLAGALTEEGTVADASTVEIKRLAPA